MTDLIGQLTSWAAGLRYGDIPRDTVAFARSQIISNLAAVRASAAHPLGRKIVATYGSNDPATESQRLAALAMCLEYDEVGYSGHPSASGVNVAIAHSAGLDGRQLLAAVVAANECALRFQASTLLGAFFRGQAATYTHLLGTVAARLHVAGAAPSTWADAARLAFGILPTPVDNTFLSSDAKVFVAAIPVRMALDACAAAQAGMRGPVGVLEGDGVDGGVLSKLSDVPMPDALVAGLGDRWHTDTLSFKRFPASAYLQAPFECAERIAARSGPFAADDIVDVCVDGSMLTWMLQMKAEPHLAGSDSSTSALTFSAGYGIATLLLTGSLGPQDLHGDHLDRWAVADRVRVDHDLLLTKTMIEATVPLGEALRQAGPRAYEMPAIVAFGDMAKPVLDALGPPSETFTDATMAIGARVVVKLRDGTVLIEELERATGMAGPLTRTVHPALAEAKFLDCGGSEEVLKELSRLDELDAAELTAVLTKALA